MARPGLYDELVKLDLLDKARTILIGDGSDPEKADRIDELITRKGSDFNVTPRAVFILRGRLGIPAATSESQTPTPKQVPAKTDGGPAPQKAKPKPPPGPNKGSFKPGHKGGPGAKFGNTNAVKTGAYVNPLLHHMPAERVREVLDSSNDPPEVKLQKSIDGYLLVLAGMYEELARIQASPKAMVVLGASFVRQEGDGAIAGTFRQSGRKRVPRVEAIAKLSKDIAMVQAKHDKAVRDLHEMTKGGQPEDPQAGLKALAEAIRSSREKLKKGNGTEGGGTA